MEDNGTVCKYVKSSAEAIVTPAPTDAAVAAPIAAPVASEAIINNGKGAQSKLAEPEELLGSVTTQNCPGTRASARVIQKMKLDLTRPMTPPPSERELSKKEEKATQKTPSQMRAANKTTWTNLERNYFFDALNEFGKDFEALANCINAKLKRRNTSSDYSFKSKDQVRQHYYQTYHKIGKYVRYSDELKKPAQELYTLINYGEMRRKLQFLTEKHFMKLKQLIFHGHIIVRSKGKNIRIKTPSCKALRRLNQLDDTLEDIRLPSKIEVLVSPANMEAFGRVQCLAQNPRGRAVVPLHKKLVSFIQTFQYKWRSADARLAEEQIMASGCEAHDVPITEPAICFQPKPGVAIHRPLLSITAYLSSINICLTAYEERLGIKVRSETLENNTMSSAAGNAKRARTESGSEKRSPESKKVKSLSSPAYEKSSLDELTDGNSYVKLESNNIDDLNESIVDLMMPLPSAFVPTDSVATASTNAISTSICCSSSSSTSAFATQSTAIASSIQTGTATSTTISTPASARSKRDSIGPSTGKSAKTNAGPARNFKPLLSDEVIKRIRRGWTVSNAADITIGDLYVVLGQDSKLELEYYWCDAETNNLTSLSGSSSSSSSSTLPYNTNDCDSAERVKAITTATVSNKLKHLLMVANLSERVRKRQCNCGHSCDRKRDLITKTQWLSNLANGTAGAASASGSGTSITNAADGNEVTFRTPMLPFRRPMGNFIDPVRQFSKLTRQKMSRQVLVQRCILPPTSDASRPYDLVSLRNLQNGLFEPIDRQIVSSSSSSSDYQSLSHHSTLAMPISSKSTSISSNISFLQSEDNQSYSRSSSPGLGLNMPNLEQNADASVTEAATSTTTLPDGAQDENTALSLFNGSVSPMHLLRDSTSNARWLEENINDFSLTSLLGHLDDFDATRDILDPSSSLSVISESSVDFRHKFQEISALLQQQEKD